jgi:histone H3/H4
MHSKGVNFQKEHKSISLYPNMQIQAKNNPYEREVLIIKSHVQKWIKEKNMYCKASTYRSINDAVIELLEKAIVRTKLSKRKTICPQDI